MSKMDELRTSEVVRIPEALKLLKVSRNHLMKGIKDGRIPTVNILGMVRIPRRWLDERIAQALGELQTSAPEKPPSKREYRRRAALAHDQEATEAAPMAAMSK